MSKPWENEPTPTTKQAILDTHGHWTFELRDRMENLERRLRHAERLLDHVLWNSNGFEDDTSDRINKHLEAGRKEDGR